MNKRINNLLTTNTIVTQQHIQKSREKRKRKASKIICVNICAVALLECLTMKIHTRLYSIQQQQCSNSCINKNSQELTFYHSESERQFHFIYLLPYFEKSLFLIPFSLLQFQLNSSHGHKYFFLKKVCRREWHARVVER